MLRLGLGLAVRLQGLRNETRMETLTEKPCFPLAGESPAIQAVCRSVRRVAASDAAVLIQGEPGTGKGLVARLIHERSLRSRAPFETLDCRLEAERIGFVDAGEGTLFLDNVGALGAADQVRLLKKLEEWQNSPIGGAAPRLIAATSQDLAARAAAGQFRQDLYYRLAVVPICLPPLRERPEDLPMLIEEILGRLRRRGGQAVPRSVSAEALPLLRQYRWPGNVRELEAVIEYASVFSGGERIGPEDLPPHVRGENHQGGCLFDRLEQTERRLLADALRESRSAAEAARRLGMSRATLFRKARQHGLKIAELQSRAGSQG